MADDSSETPGNVVPLRKPTAQAKVQSQRARLLAAQAQRAELEFLEKSGKLVDAEVVGKATFDAGRRFRDAMLNIPPRVEALVQAAIDAGEAVTVRKLLDDEIRRALEEFADGPGPDRPVH